MGAMVERASSVPLSASCMVNRAEMLALVERARAELPVELDQAAELLVAHQEVISRAESEAEELLAQAQADAEQMITESALVASAEARSEQILDAARAEAARLLRECDLYCDNRLGALEETLNRSLGQVRRGRDRLRERSELDHLEPLPDDADPQGYDVQAEHEQAVERQRERDAWAQQPADTGQEAYDQELEDDAGAVRALPAGPVDPAGSGPEAAEHDTQGDARGDQDRQGGDPGAADPVIHDPVRPEGAPPGHGGDGLTPSPSTRGPARHPDELEYERIPAGVGSGLATGPEKRVLDLTAVERAAERSGLG
ncbi:hypothetical protein KIH74_12660 [Kineosporia sp. J2-2]|uniref:Uncharacterized protein n=1 Tax=Kineosporia corallincola TaxID=2835133 RepID=A0ABS5TFF1_9ACTN|nr:hypothetical protein [Kineosporia corallincola]MBT0769780.1 hypothetical protein [Kineosporia corallincola]